MKFILDAVNLLPKPVQLTIAGILIGGMAFAGIETRYMTVSDFTKSYVLDLKKVIREIEYDLQRLELTDRERHDLEMELEELIDELCYEKPDDRLCQEDDDGDSI
jgi:hypothetical protein